MTKRKPHHLHKRRGRKVGPDNDGATWVAIELRRNLGNVGRARGSIKRALEFLAADLDTIAGVTVNVKTLSNRYYRANERRRTDMSYATKLNRWLDKESIQVTCGLQTRHGRKVAAVVNWLPPIVLEKNSGRN